MFLGFLLTVSLNLNFIDCQNIPFQKNDIDNYMEMFTGIQNTDIYHIFYVSQIKSIMRFTGYSASYVVFYTMLLKAYLFFPFCIFLFYCSINRSPRQALYAVVLLYSFTWFLPMHLLLGLHAQFDSMLFYVIYLCANNLRKKVYDTDLEIVFYGSIFFSVISHPYILFVFYLRYLFYGRKEPKILFIASVLMSAFLIYRFANPQFLFGFDGNTDLLTAFLVFPFSLVTLWYIKGLPLPKRSKKYFFALVVLGVLSDNHRMMLITMIELGYYFSLWLTSRNNLLKLYIWIFSLLYFYYTWVFWLSAFRAEIINERTITTYCFDLLTGAK